jgi:hypothetical protein
MMHRSARQLATLVAACVAVLFAAPALGEVWLEYDGYEDMGGGVYKHNYTGYRNTFEINVEDLHVHGQFEFEPGTVYVGAPGGWEGSYDGVFFNWRSTDPGNDWTVGTSLGDFSIHVKYVTVTSSPFHWTDDRDDPQGLESIISGGSGMVDAPVPEPSTVVLLGMGMVGLLVYASRKRR